MIDPKSSAKSSATPESLVTEPAAGSEESTSLPVAPLYRRKKFLLIVGGTLVLALAAGALGWALVHPKAAPSAVTVSPKPTPDPLATPVISLPPLTGLKVTPEIAARQITGVIIENHPDARPQSGLGQAGVVYEANAEGGITRFLAFFLDQRPASVGPVRSLRTYFLDWGLEFNSPVAHAGGNADALDLVSPLGMKDINALSFASDGFFRTTDKAAPHNLYTNSDKLDALEQRYGFAKPASFTVSPRKADTPNAAAPHPNIHIDYSYAGYQVDYKYDPATNDYGRWLSGIPHFDRNTNTQIRVKNIVVEMMPTSYGTTRIGESTVIMQTVGRGQGWVLRDGDAIACTWVKDAHNARTKLIDAAGAEIPLDAGNTWYSIVPVGKNVSF
jgi:hypothetical protein